MTQRGDPTLLMNRMVAFELVATYLNQSTIAGRTVALDALVAEIKAKNTWRAETDENYFRAIRKAESAPDDLLEHVLRRYGTEAD